MHIKLYTKLHILASGKQPEEVSQVWMFGPKVGNYSLFGFFFWGGSFFFKGYSDIHFNGGTVLAVNHYPTFFWGGGESFLENFESF